jgi:hypothetical protein
MRCFFPVGLRISRFQGICFLSQNNINYLLPQTSIPLSAFHHSNPTSFLFYERHNIEHKVGLLFNSLVFIFMYIVWNWNWRQILGYKLIQQQHQHQQNIYNSLYAYMYMLILLKVWISERIENKVVLFQVYIFHFFIASRRIPRLA